MVNTTSCPWRKLELWAFNRVLVFSRGRWSDSHQASALFTARSADYDASPAVYIIRRGEQRIHILSSLHP
ncbi:unnamed protein product [Urochloa humidicola]